VCVYIAPPLSAERLSRRRNGDILLRLKRPFSDGTAFILFEPLEFIEKLAALVPPRWANLTRYHGCLAPRSKARGEIVPNDKTQAHKGRTEWSEILKRSFGIDIFQCGYCGGKTKVTPAILDKGTLKSFLKSMKLPTEPPQAHPARVPPQGHFDWGA